MRKTLQFLREDISAWRRGWWRYIERKLARFGRWFENQKNVLVEVLMVRRGTYQRPFLYFSLTVLVVSGVLAAPILANAYPGGLPASLSEYTPSSAVVTS